MQSLKLELTIEETNLMLAALTELPYKVSSNLINKVMAQAQAQTAQPEPQPED